MNLTDNQKWLIRGAFALALVVSGGLVVVGGSSGGSSDTDRLDLYEQSQLPPSERPQIAAPRDGVTLITASNKKPLVGLAPNGTLKYYENKHKSYWDVDPIPGTKRTVLYSATDKMEASRCPVESSCTRNVVERLNLSTGERETLYVRFRPGLKNNEWHDVDRIDDARIVVAGLDRDRVSVVNTTTGLVEWQWEAQSDFNITSGGSGAFSTSYPEDWTHLNDVEYVNGTIIVSLRNQDQVVFLDAETGMVEDMTLGSDDDYDVLYEQHNPDYIPASNGGPALLVADSQNNRIVEYERRDGEWTQTWVWGDSAMQWPRDADRLPNGNTLIADTNSRRILEVGPDGNVVWKFTLPKGYRSYDVERLGTGDESAGGPSASRADLTNKTKQSGDTFTRGGNPSLKLWVSIKGYVPSKLLNGLLFVKPGWLSFTDLPYLLFGGAVAFAWALVEYRWLAISVAVRSPLVFERE